MRSAGPLTRLKRTSTPARVPAVASWSQAHGRALSEGGAVRHCGMKQKRPKRWFAPVWWVSLYKWAGRLTQVMLELHLTTRAILSRSSVKHARLRPGASGLLWAGISGRVAASSRLRPSRIILWIRVCSLDEICLRFVCLKGLQVERVANDSLHSLHLTTRARPYLELCGKLCLPFQAHSRAKCQRFWQRTRRTRWAFLLTDLILPWILFPCVWLVSITRLNNSVGIQPMIPHGNFFYST